MSTEPEVLQSLCMQEIDWSKMCVHKGGIPFTNTFIEFIITQLNH